MQIENSVTQNNCDTGLQAVIPAAEFSVHNSQPLKLQYTPGRLLNMGLDITETRDGPQMAI